VWNVKWGEEVNPEVFSTRLLWAMGYITEPSYFVPHGVIESVGALGRASQLIAKDGSFRNARFELRDPKYYPVRRQNWSFRDLPPGPQVNGLKIMIMLVSNWDIKDARSGDPDPNTSTMKRELEGGAEEAHYIINDWGATMGRWGGIATRSKWDCEGYAEQSKDFVKGFDGGSVKWGFEGKQRSDIADGITPADVQWLVQFLGQVTDEQLRSALTASGADDQQTACYTTAIRSRIDQLRNLTATTTTKVH
jgi:hypothetical protein